MISPKSKFAGALLADPRAVSPVDGAAPSPSVAPAPAPAPALPTTRARAMSIFPSVTPPPPPKPPAPPLLPKHEYTTVLRDLVIAQRHMLDMQHGATAARSRRKGGEGRVEMRAAALQKVLARLAYIPPPARAPVPATTAAGTVKGHQPVAPPVDLHVRASTSPLPPPPVARSAAASPTSVPNSPTARSPALPASPPPPASTPAASPPPTHAASSPPAAGTPSSPTRRRRALSVALPRPTGAAAPRKPASPTRSASPTRTPPATDHDDMLRALHAMGDKYARLLASDDLDPTASLTATSTNSRRRAPVNEPTVLRVVQPHHHRRRNEKSVVVEDDQDARVLAWVAARDLARDTFCVGPVHVAATDAAWQRRRDLHARMVAVARVNRGKGREVAGEVLVESGAGRRARFAPRQVKEQKVVRKPEPRMDVLGAKYSVRHTLVPRTPHRLPVTTNSTDAAIDHGGPRDDWNLWTPARRRARLHAQASQPTPTAPTAALPGHGVLGWEPLAPRAAFDGRAVRYAAVPARAVADALPHLAVPASAVGGNEVVGMGGSVWDAVRVLGGPLGGEDGVEGDGPVQRRGRGTVEKEEGGERMDGEEVEEEEEEEEERVGGEVVVVGERENEGVGEEVGDRGGEMVGGEGEEGDEEDEDWGEDEDEEEDGEDGEDEDESSDAGGDSDVGDNGPGSAAETVASTE